MYACMDEHVHMYIRMRAHTHTPHTITYTHTHTNINMCTHIHAPPYTHTWYYVWLSIVSVHNLKIIFCKSTTFGHHQQFVNYDYIVLYVTRSCNAAWTIHPQLSHYCSTKFKPLLLTAWPNPSLQFTKLFLPTQWIPWHSNGELLQYKISLSPIPNFLHTNTACINYISINPYCFTADL